MYIHVYARTYTHTQFTEEEVSVRKIAERVAVFKNVFSEIDLDVRSVKGCKKIN